MDSLIRHCAALSMATICCKCGVTKALRVTMVLAPALRASACRWNSWKSPYEAFIAATAAWDWLLFSSKRAVLVVQPMSHHDSANIRFPTRLKAYLKKSFANESSHTISSSSAARALVRPIVKPISSGEASFDNSPTMLVMVRKKSLAIWRFSHSAVRSTPRRKALLLPCHALVCRPVTMTMPNFILFDLSLNMTAAML